MKGQDDADQGRRKAAADWVTKLSRTSVSNDELEAFFLWRRDPENRRIWGVVTAGRRTVDRYVVRRQTERFRVVDIWTGQTAIIAMTSQDDLSEEDAVHIAGLLNRRAKGGDRSVLQ